MIEAVVALRDKTVEQIMTPRTEIAAMEYTDDLGAVTGIIRKIGHSRIPVYKGSLDTIVGIFYVMDLMKWLAGSGVRAGSNKPFELQAILRPALFVPETKTVRELMKELLEKKLHIAMVADEYGGTAGLVTIEDIVEEVFGEIYDETNRRRRRRTASKWTCRAARRRWTRGRTSRK
jgi:CBS domain containing-hemolysin-like protein